MVQREMENPGSEDKVGVAIRGVRDKGTSRDLDALWAVQIVSSPDRFDGSVTRSDPSGGGRRRLGTGRAPSSHRLPAGRPAIRLERRPVGVGSGNRVESVPCRRLESPDRTGSSRSGRSAGVAAVPSGRVRSAGTPSGPDRADHVGPWVSPCRASRRRSRPDRHHPPGRRRPGRRGRLSARWASWTSGQERSLKPSRPLDPLTPRFHATVAT